MYEIQVATTTSFANWFEHCGLYKLKPRSQCPLPGPTAEVYHTLLEGLGMPYKLLPQEDPYYGNNINGTWDEGLLGQLERGEIDMISQFWMNTAERREMFEFSYPAYMFDLAFIIKANEPAVASNSWLLFKVFGLWTWVTLLLLLLVALVAVMFARRAKTVGDILEGVAPSEKPADKRGIKLMLVVYGIGCLVFVNLYQDSLLAKLSKPHLTPLDPWEVPKLIGQKKLTLVLGEKSDYRYQSILKSQNYFYKTLREAVETNPIVFEKNFSKLLQMVSSGKFVYLSSYASTAIFQMQNCGVESIRGYGFPEHLAGPMVRKGWPHLARLNKTLIKFQGRMENIVTRYVNLWNSIAKDHCQASRLARMGVQPLTVMAYSGLFFAVVISGVLGGLVLMAERWSAHRDGKRKKTLHLLHAKKNGSWKYEFHNYSLWKTMLLHPE